MAPRKKYNNKKKYNKKKYTKKRQTLSIQKGPTFSAQQMVKLNYVETISLNPATGLVADYVFSANGMYDPNITGTGHQPLGFDQWMTFYDHYTVIGAKISATWHSAGDTNTSQNAGYVGIVLADAATSLSGTAIDYIIEQGKTSYKPFGESNSGNAIVTVSRRSSTKKFFGRSDIMDNSDLRGSASGNPTEQYYFHLWAAPVAPSFDPELMYATVKIQYIAILTEPKLLAQS